MPFKLSSLWYFVDFLNCYSSFPNIISPGKIEIHPKLHIVCKASSLFASSEPLALACRCPFFDLCFHMVFLQCVSMSEFPLPLRILVVLDLGPFLIISVQFSPSVFPTLLDSMDCSTPGFPVHQQLLELNQTHVH